MIGISGYGYSTYSAYTPMTGGGLYKDAAASMSPASALKDAQDEQKAGTIKNPGESTKVSPGKKSSPAECETCRERKYQDGSDEMVSFKSAAHISPEAAASAVRSHEQEHVSNAYKKAAMNDGKVLQASVAIKMAVCPECGRSYVSGGVTHTQIKYGNESNPYQKDKKNQDAMSLKGANVDLAV